MKQKHRIYNNNYIICTTNGKIVERMRRRLRFVWLEYVLNGLIV